MTKIKEVELARQLIKSFDGTDYEVYQEVETYVGIADVVLKYADFTWAIECKTSLSLQVIAQAWHNCRIYNFSSICVPWVKQSKGSEFAHEVCRRYGIGIFKHRYGSISEPLPAKLNRYISKTAVRLCERQKTYAKAGNCNGDRWTPFNQTVDQLKQYIKKYPGCRLKDVLSEINHHYHTLSTAQSSIRQWINTGVIKGISLNRGILTLEENENKS